MKTCSLAVVTVVCALICAGPAAAAVTLGDGSYDVAFSVSEAGADFAGTKSVSGGLGVEAFDSLEDGVRSIGFSATLDSDLALRLSIEPLGASSFGYPLVGTPAQIVDELDVLTRMGVDGCLISWVNYKEELAQWVDQVLPLMEQAGQRRKLIAA